MVLLDQPMIVYKPIVEGKVFVYVVILIAMIGTIKGKNLKTKKLHIYI